MIEPEIDQAERPQLSTARHSFCFGTPSSRKARRSTILRRLEVDKQIERGAVWGDAGLIAGPSRLFGMRAMLLPAGGPSPLAS
jgi:hypothetical protein